MTSIPTQITTEQRRAACRALGFPAALVHDLRVHRAGVRANVFVLDRESRRIAHGDAPLTAAVDIPFLDG
ncbi:hypothetical protein [Streptomyces racemochromogenes]|uniref:hypothetical protein n=1 Tax=Streptomyces racemochromogenes TaxID=67353 RepID=UPI0035E924F0